MSKVKVGIIGGAGYTGGELIRILLNHPNVELTFVHSASNGGNPFYKVHTDLIGETVEHTAVVSHERGTEVDEDERDREEATEHRHRKRDGCDPGQRSRDRQSVTAAHRHQLDAEHTFAEGLTASSHEDRFVQHDERHPGQHRPPFEHERTVFEPARCRCAEEHPHHHQQRPVDDAGADPLPDRRQHANAAFEKAHSRYLDTNSAYAYTGVLVIADILERAASTDPEKILAATRQTNFTDHPVVSGPIQFDEKGDNTGALTALIQVQPDDDLLKRIKIVAPKEFAQSDKIVFPAPQLWER